MTWFKVDDGLAFHAKVVQAGNAAMGLWVRAGSWCAQQLTDGFVPDHIVTTLGTKGQAKALADARLWVRGEGGYQFHGWNEDGRQPTREQVEKDRAEARERMRKAREAKRGSGDVRANTERSSDDVRSTRPVPSRPDPSLGSRETYGGDVRLVDAHDPNEPPRCSKHANTPREDVPGCWACGRKREQWESERAEAAKPKPLPAWCGECWDTTARHIDTAKGVARCPRCNPLATKEAS